jgi:two-component system cell cycle response regulator
VSAVEALVYRARENERILARYQQLELRLLSADSSTQLLCRLLRETRESLKLDAIELWLSDPREALAELLRTDEWPELRLVPGPQRLQQVYGSARPAVALLERAGIRRLALFGGRDLATAAALPLVRGGALIGSLHFGSLGQRYRADLATDFLGHLASIVGICIENALNQERLRQLGMLDALTEVKNRRGFDMAVGEELARLRRSKGPLSLLLLDLDHFKRINDQHGHVTGDRALRSVAQQISRLVRGTDHVFRYGGEEFAVLLPNCDTALARQIAERIRTGVAALAVTNDSGDSLQVTLSVGICCIPGSARLGADQVVAAAMLRSADHALYTAKKNGRNRIEQVAFAA